MAQKIDFSNTGKNYPAEKNPESENLQRADAQKGSYEEALKSLKEDYPEKIMFGIEEVSALLGQSYESIRCRVKDETIKSTSFGSRKMIHIIELARLITEGF